MTRRDDELSLVRRLIAGEETALEEFADHHLPALYRFASRRLEGDRELTREIVQSTLCKAIDKLETFRGEAALLTWLCACCRNEIAGHFRRRKRTLREVELDAVEETSPAALQVEPQAGPEGELLQREASDRVHLALDSLPPHYGRALEWKYIQGLSVKEIAARLDLGPKAAESVLSRARASFKDEYGRLLEEALPAGEHPRRAVI